MSKHNRQNGNGKDMEDMEVGQPRGAMKEDNSVRLPCKPCPAAHAKAQPNLYLHSPCKPRQGP